MMGCSPLSWSVLALALNHGLAFHCSTMPYSSQVPMYTVCPSINQAEKFHNGDTDTSNCDYVSKITLPSKNCGHPELPMTESFVCWRVLDTLSGTVEISFPLHPHCNFTEYMLYLMTNEVEQCNLNNEYLYERHTSKNVNIEQCTSDACKHKCTDRGKAVFRFLYTACYSLSIVPMVQYSVYQELSSEPVVIKTQYTKNGISSDYQPTITFANKTSTNGMAVRVRSDMCPAKLLIKLLHGFDASDPDNCRSSGHILTTCNVTLNSQPVECNIEPQSEIQPVCTYENVNTVSCEFSNLRAGNYCARLEMQDERCIIHTVWNNAANYTTCTWHAFNTLGQFEDQAVVVSEDNPFDSTSNRIMLVLMILAIIGACVVTGVVIYRRMLPHYPQFLPVRHKTLVLTQRPVVLLLYARDCPPFMQAVQQLRNVLSRVYDCQIVDCWEDSQYSVVTQNPSRWLLSRLADRRVMVMLITNLPSLLQEAALLRGTTITYRQPTGFDKVFTHALSTLHDIATRSTNSYCRVFVVRLDNPADSQFPITRTYLNLATTYVLPLHLNNLMATLHNLDPGMSSITADGQMDVALLSEAISRYQQFLQENSQYLDSLLITDGDMTIQKMLEAVKDICL